MGDNELGFAIGGDNELVSSVEIVNEFRGMLEFSGGDSFRGCLTLCLTKRGVNETDFSGAGFEIGV